MKKELRYLFTSDYPGHRDDILAFWARENGDQRQHSFDSLYSGNPLGPPALALCYDGDKLVGTENFIAQKLSFSGKLLNAHMGIDTLVDSKYRLFQGVFGKLCKLTIDKMADESDLLFTVANEKSKKYYLKYFDWKVVTTMDIFKKVTYPTGLNPRSALSFVRPGRLFRDITLKPVSNFLPEDLDSLLEDYRIWCLDAYFHKTALFLNWKFLNNQQYKIDGYLILTENRPCGYIITYDDNDEKKVLDFIVKKNNPDIFRKVILTLSKLTTDSKMALLSVVATPNAWYRPILSKLAFLKRWENDYITYTYHEDIPDSVWVIHPGDLDVF